MSTLTPSLQWQGSWAKLLVVLGFVVALTIACQQEETGRPLAVGDPAPAFALPGADGVTVSLAEQLEDAPVLLYFHMGFG